MGTLDGERRRIQILLEGDSAGASGGPGGAGGPPAAQPINGRADGPMEV